MKALSWSADDAEKIIENEIQNEEQECFKEALIKIEKSESYAFVEKMLKESSFYSMPYSSKMAEEPYYRYMLDCIDYSKALSEAWDIEVSEESIALVCIIARIGEFGYKCSPKFEKKISTRSKVYSSRWVQNQTWSSRTSLSNSLAVIMQDKLPLSRVEYDAVLFITLGIGKSELGMLVEFSNKFIKENVIC